MEEIFCTEVVKHWNNLPREMVDAPFLETILGEIGQGAKQPDLIKDVSVYCRGVWTS